MFWPPSSRFGRILFALSLGTMGCSAKIGDKCTIGTDCSQTGSRACDTSLPDGYCTIFNCEPDSCPSESACIGFVTAPSTLMACASTYENREIRRFCMRGCSSTSECRAGYECVDLAQPNNPWGATLDDINQSNAKVRILPFNSLPAIKNSDAKSDYCSAAEYVDNGYYDVSSGGSTSGGSTSGGSTSSGSTSSGNSSGGSTSGGSTSSGNSSGGSTSTNGASIP